MFSDMFVQDNENQISMIQCLNVAGGFDFNFAGFSRYLR